MDFNDFWAAYPKRTPHANPKRPAMLAWQRALKRGATPQQLVSGAKGYADTVQRLRTDPKFVCMAVTFLNQDRYEDYVNAVPQTASIRELMLGKRG